MQVLATLRRVRLVASIGCLVVLSLWCPGSTVSAQSTDITSPAAVRTPEVVGTIAARDIGDPRLTDHYYAFTGTPGDLLITVDSRNLNGDVDVFTTSGLRPLLKLTVYAGNSSPMTKSIYLRKREDLILRIEGRTPNDDDATYRLQFGGSFEPVSGESSLAANEGAATEPAVPGGKSGKKGRRVSSVGARIEEPPSPEVVAAPTPEPSPAESTEVAKTEKAKPEAAPSRVTKAPVTRAPTRTARGRRLPGRRAPVPAPPPKDEPAPPKEEPAKSTTEPTTATTENTEAEAKPAPTKTRPPKRNSRTRTVAKAPVEPEPETGPRLVIETSDGTLINRYMSSVRRVVVENGQVVVSGKDGKVERIPLASIVRMSIAP
jgi:hypothetical protein